MRRVGLGRHPRGRFASATPPPRGAPAPASPSRSSARAGPSGDQVWGDALYARDEIDGAPDAAVAASLGCGVPTAVADLHEGEVVLDLGSGGGADVLISAKRVGPTGKAYGLDMTDEMLELARANATEAGADQRRVPQGLPRGHPAPRRQASTSSSATASSTSPATSTACWPKPPASCGPAAGSRSPT